MCLNHTIITIPFVLGILCRWGDSSCAGCDPSGGEERLPPHPQLLLDPDDELPNRATAAGATTGQRQAHVCVHDIHRLVIGKWCGGCKSIECIVCVVGEGKGEGEGDGAAAPMAFDDFYRRPVVQPLRNQLLYEKYYSRRLIDAEASATEFALPDLKPLPSVV